MRYLKLTALGLLILIIFLAVSFVILLGPKSAEATDKVDIVIAAGQSRAQISQELVSKNLIKSSFAFYLYSKLIRSAVLPGTYEFSPNQSASTIAEMLAGGKIKKLKITIIEGWRVSQMTDYLVNEKKLTQLADFTDKATVDEGYLFPDTYEIKVDITSDELIKLMRDNFTERTKDLDIKPDTVILASIIEREALNDDDRAQIAAVYINRLKIGMKLEADPTVQYAKGNWASPTVADYHSVNSPYNTYLHDGLPPGPICSPGLASIKGVINPAKNDYLFFFHAKGETHFSKTLEEHRAKVKLYF